MKERQRIQAFEITEPPHEVAVPGGLGSQDPWPALQQEARRLEERASEAESSLRKSGDAHDGARRKFLLDLIEDVMDNLDRSLADVDGNPSDPAAQRWIKKLQRNRRTMEALLAREQAVPIDLVQAPDGLVTTRDEVPRDDVPDGTIVEVDYRGWLWRGEVLRKASVVRATSRDHVQVVTPAEREGSNNG